MKVYGIVYEVVIGCRISIQILKCFGLSGDNILKLNEKQKQKNYSNY